jgi:hypothetical protein|tara:strand:- start:3660 stop:3785 length:126 start_codon:yes stop_codon:yes gene_type:complete
MERRIKSLIGLILKIISVPFLLIGGIGAILLILEDIMYEEL